MREMEMYFRMFLLVNKMLYPVPSKNAEISFEEAEKCNSSRCNYSDLLL